MDILIVNLPYSLENTNYIKIILLFNKDIDIVIRP